MSYWFVFFSVGILLFRVYSFKLSEKVFWFVWAMMLCYINYYFGVSQLLITVFATLFIRFVNIDTRSIIGNGLFQLGTLSYSLYLIHISIGKVLFHYVKLSIVNDLPFLKLFLFILIAIVFSALYYFIIELPAKSFSKTITMKKLEGSKDDAFSTIR